MMSQSPDRSRLEGLPIGATFRVRIHSRGVVSDVRIVDHAPGKRPVVEVVNDPVFAGQIVDADDWQPVGT